MLDPDVMFSGRSRWQVRSVRYWGRGDVGLSPVIFVHGYASTERVWAPLRDALGKVGFDCLIALRYNAFRSDIGEVADRLVDQAAAAMASTGAARVHLIGHSLGGLVVREAVLRRGLAANTGTAVTIATPHHGTFWARFGFGPSARQMRPGSLLLEELSRLTGRSAIGPDGRLDPTIGPRWIACHGKADRVVSARSAVPAWHGPAGPTALTAPAGHGSIVRHPKVVAAVVTELLRAERQIAPSAAA